MTIEHISSDVDGTFVDLNGERYYKISNVDHMAPFFISVVSASDHWLFVSSTGSLSAGRIRPENALFPYKSVDHIHENAENTGSKTLVRIKDGENNPLWEPFNVHHDGLYCVERHLYKNTIGDKIVFEEINHSLKIAFQYSWNTSEAFGFVRDAKLTDLSNQSREIEILDGVQNLLPSGAPLSAMQTRSALVDAYKWNERVEGTDLALYTMYAKLSDRADPAESLLATTVFSVDSDDNTLLLSSKQVKSFRKGLSIEPEDLTKGFRGSYFINKTITLNSGQSNQWTIVADIDKDHRAVVDLKRTLTETRDLSSVIDANIEANQQELISLMSGADAWQLTAEETTSVHHYANVLFNNMRGGVFEHNYQLDKADVTKTIAASNRKVFEANHAFFELLPQSLSHPELVRLAKETGDAQLVRLCYEYLPLTFGRRHGDPSRPWNHYEINLKDSEGDRLLSYQGNWRDIFQNWEAIAHSYPGYISSFLAKFVNASTADGYNPYRITKDGIDWELLEPEDPWSNIGYWGDHQIIYLLKFLELADKYQSEDLKTLLGSNIFSYANVPYRICSVDGLFENPKDTVSFSGETQALTVRKSQELGSDGRLLLNSDDTVYSVNLVEKILVPLLAKLSNLVVDGGIWLNTQRPEWNDANNAIVGNGLSMVTLYYMRRYVVFTQQLLAQAESSYTLSTEVADWLNGICVTLVEVAKELQPEAVSSSRRYEILNELSLSAERYRNTVYKQGFTGKTSVQVNAIQTLLGASLKVIDHSISTNLRQDGLFNAYNILDYKHAGTETATAKVEELYPMLEGQVSVLSSGALTPEQAVELLDKLFESEMYRADQHSFMLYPDRDLTHFMNKNSIDSADISNCAALTQMLGNGDQRIVNQDANGHYHFNAHFENSGFLAEQVEKVKADYPSISTQEWQPVFELYEQVFNHKAFTGRSGTMFGYEGLGCIYWHMVSKLLLAVQENYLTALKQDPNSEACAQLSDYYYKVRDGIGFNKTPLNYGAFPTDPYSHTPKTGGAQQPGMTGQVKEEVITRFIELGLMVDKDGIEIRPTLLNKSEFLLSEATFKYQDIAGNNHQFSVMADQLAFTYCQVPFVYALGDTAQVTVHHCNGQVETADQTKISASVAHSLYQRRGDIERIVVTLPREQLRA
ncbi:hypothetical protein KP803_12375 [Vibrio sp. ZSDE26]|uniref:Cellobiose phosphorylase n=1 Tax=Vibrio amylolyticus TaxID=2847292 RepID=A0A9X2BK31_9VIBR|nr:hypothetical protein [Vibrio amylolyticus]MCK6264067.1 hypothetical protein [Vibrio amylolyticus]